MKTDREISKSSLLATDPLVFDAIEQEHQRQQYTLELIASENIASAAVRAAQGSVFTNKYAEGYPGQRYYGGCEQADRVERLAIERAKQLFGASWVNVQAHSGSQANMAAYFSFLTPGDVVLAMDLAHGGHLTHGSRVSFSGQFYRFVHYGVNGHTGTIDYDAVADLAKAHRPKMIVCGASAYPRTIDFERFGAIAKATGALLMVDMAHIAGLVAAGLHPSPLPVADVVTSTTHKTLRGPRGGLILSTRKAAERIDSAIFPGTQGGPLMQVIAAKAVAFQEALQPAFKAYQQQVMRNAQTLAETLKTEGLQLVSGGTDNHMILVDFRGTDTTGAAAETILEQAGITVNKNSVPFDPRGPRTTSGIRIGSPVLTTRGMGEAEMRQVALWIAQVIARPEQAVAETVRASVRELCAAFPVPAGDDPNWPPPLC